MPELAVLIPTRGRPGNIRKVISAWDFTCAWDVADMVLIVDADDPEIQGYREISAEFVEGCPPGTPSPLTLLEIPKWLPMVHKLDAAARDLASQYFALGFAGDDHLPQTINWAKRYLEVLHELDTGMVYGDDGYQGIKLSTEWAITADVVRELGRMVPAPVEHMYCDNSMMDLFRGAGALRHLPEIRIEHMHPIVGKAETDAQYQRVNHRDQFKTDRFWYEDWKRSLMASDVASVRLLRTGREDFIPEAAARPKLSPGSGPRRVDLRRKGNKIMSNRLPVPRSLRNVRGATPDEIGLTLADMAITVPADQAIVEIGVFQGRTALLMAWGAQQGNGAHVWGIDAWNLDGNTYDEPFLSAENWARYNVQATGHNSHVTLVKGFSFIEAEKWSGPEAGGIPVGLLFIDGDHSKDGARRDVLTWAPHLAPGATIALDDYDHPDWPGVREAIEELVAEGVIEPPEIFHDRLAVTRLTVQDTGDIRLDDLVSDLTSPVTAITSEGVSPSPYPAAEGQVAVPDEVDQIFDGPTGPDFTPQWPEDKAETDWNTVKAGELEGVEAGTEVTGMNLVHLKALAKARRIKLGARKDLRIEILQALRDGR